MTTELDEATFLNLAADAWKKILSALDRIDPEDADADARADVIHITLRDGTKAVVNTQRPVRQIWLAGLGRGWHFAWDADSRAWKDDRGSGDELYAMLARIVQSGCGKTVAF